MKTTVLIVVGAASGAAGTAGAASEEPAAVELPWASSGCPGLQRLWPLLTPVGFVLFYFASGSVHRHQREGSIYVLLLLEFWELRSGS
jgi:hypothetical protein